MNEQQQGQEEQFGDFHEEGNLPNVFGELNEGGEEDYDDEIAEDENVEDNDDEDLDAHSADPSEGEEFAPEQDDDDDDDIVVLN
uniref:Uncharacterized protein n=1 Tax=Panagrolaimus sp. JU765 TaxID=591449 RepID=A0AC34QD77_9BILA